MTDVLMLTPQHKQLALDIKALNNLDTEICKRFAFSLQLS